MSSFLVKAIAMSLSVAIRNARIEEREKLDWRARDPRDKIKAILARSFWLYGEAVSTVINNHLAEIEVQPRDVDDRERAIVTVLSSACTWLDHASRALEGNEVHRWIARAPFKVPKGLQMSGFTLCDETIPDTVAALRHVFYGIMWEFEQAGLRDACWGEIGRNPAFRVMLGLEDPDEHVETSIKSRRTKWSESDCNDKPLGEILDAARAGGTWIVSTGSGG